MYLWKILDTETNDLNNYIICYETFKFQIDWTQFLPFNYNGKIAFIFNKWGNGKLINIKNNSRLL